MSSIKTSAKRDKHSKAQVRCGFSSGSMYNLPPPDRLQEEARIQVEVQNRLSQLAVNSKPGTEKVTEREGGGVC